MARKPVNICTHMPAYLPFCIKVKEKKNSFASYVYVRPKGLPYTKKSQKKTYVPILVILYKKQATNDANFLML